MNNSIEIFCTNNSPWFYSCEASASTLTNLAFQLNRDCREKVCVRIFRGDKMKNIAGLFDEFSAALQFPYYFGANWDAFDECLADLDWLNAPGYLCIILNSDKLLLESDDASSQLATFMRILLSCAEEWSKPVTSGESCDRPGKPFHVIFHTSADKSSSLKVKMQKIGCELSTFLIPEQSPH